MARRNIGVGGIACLLVLAGVLAWSGSTGLVLAIEATAAEALMVMGFYVVMGLSGQLALGLGAFGAIGAYMVAAVGAHWAPMGDVLIALPAAVVSGAVGGFMLGLPCARLKGIYLGVLTVVFSSAVAEYAVNAGWTGGATGISVPSPTILGMGLRSPVSYVVFELVVVTAGLVLLAAIRRSRFGLTLIMLRDAEPAAVASGVSAARYRVVGFMVGSALVAVGGVLLAESIGLVTPDVFSLTFSLNLQVSYVIGGVTSIGGGLLGAGVFGVVPQLVPAVTFLPGLVLGGGTVVILRFWPDGLGVAARRIGELGLSWLSRVTLMSGDGKSLAMTSGTDCLRRTAAPEGVVERSRQRD